MVHGGKLAARALKQVGVDCIFTLCGGHVMAIYDGALDEDIRVIDVRIKRIDLPPENRQAVFARMRAERDRQAKRYRSEGQQEALGIRATADRERTIILADAYRKAQAIKGQGDAEAARIYAEAFEQDPEFFDLMRTLEASCKALDDNAIFVISPEHEFLRFMKKSGANLGPD